MAMYVALVNATAGRIDLLRNIVIAIAFLLPTGGNWCPWCGRTHVRQTSSCDQSTVGMGTLNGWSPAISAWRWSSPCH